MKSYFYYNSHLSYSKISPYMPGKSYPEYPYNDFCVAGEQYNLITAAEPDFTLALKGLILATTGKEEDVDIDHEDKNKEMDIFMIR